MRSLKLSPIDVSIIDVHTSEIKSGSCTMVAPLHECTNGDLVRALMYALSRAGNDACKTHHLWLSGPAYPSCHPAVHLPFVTIFTFPTYSVFESTLQKTLASNFRQLDVTGKAQHTRIALLYAFSLLPDFCPEKLHNSTMVTVVPPSCNCCLFVSLMPLVCTSIILVPG